MVTHLELRHLRYFLAVAEELNFSRAAERLHVAQPALSAQIRAVERQLGCQLFDRTTRRVELTASGQMLLADARDILARTDEAVAKLRAAARGERGALRIGFVAHGAGEIGAEILQRFAAAFPAVRDAVRGVGNTRGDPAARPRSCQRCCVHLASAALSGARERADPVRAGVRRHDPEHRLASRPTLTRSDVTPEPIVAPWDEVPFEVLVPWLEQFRPAGRRPDDPNAKGLAECLNVASRGLAVYCVPDSVPRYHSRPDVVFRHVVDATPGHAVVVWHRELRNAAAHSFVEIARAAVRPPEGDAAIESDSF